MNLTMVLQEENARLQKQYDDCQTCKTALEVRLKDQTKELKTVSGDSADSVSNLSKLQQKMAEEQKRVEQLEKAHKNQFDAVEKDNEKLTKEMLKHLRRADQLSETVNTVITILLLTLFFFVWIINFFCCFNSAEGRVESASSSVRIHVQSNEGTWNSGRTLELCSISAAWKGNIFHSIQ